MTVYIQFTPNSDSSPPFSFSPTLNNSTYTINVFWNVYGQRWYISCFDENGNRIATEPLISSPATEDIPLMPGLFDDNTVVYRESSNNFEVT